MRKIEHPQLDNKRSKVIDRLVKDGVFKINGKQLYELSFYELMKHYTTKTN